MYRIILFRLNGVHLGFYRIMVYALRDFIQDLFEVY